MLFNYRPRAPSDAVLGNEIQEERSHFDNIKQERKRVGIWIKEDQRKQETTHLYRRGSGPYSKTDNLTERKRNYQFQ